MTSNLGSQRFVRGPGLGFSPALGGPDRPGAGGAGRRTEVLSPEFLNRLTPPLSSTHSTTLPWSPSPGSCWTRRGLAWRSWASLCLRRRVRWNCWPAAAGPGVRRPPSAPRGLLLVEDPAADLVLQGCPGPWRHAPGLRLPRQGHSSPSFPEMNGNIAQFSLSISFLLWYNAHKATPQHMHGPAGHQRACHIPV